MQAKVYVTTNKYEAQYKVYFVSSNLQEKNAAIITGGRLVSSKFAADVVVCIVNSQYEANVLITRQHFPK